MSPLLVVWSSRCSINHRSVDAGRRSLDPRSEGRGRASRGCTTACGHVVGTIVPPNVQTRTEGVRMNLHAARQRHSLVKGPQHGGLCMRRKRHGWCAEASFTAGVRCAVLYCSRESYHYAGDRGTRVVERRRYIYILYQLFVLPFYFILFLRPNWPDYESMADIVPAPNKYAYYAHVPAREHKVEYAPTAPRASSCVCVYG